MDCGVRRGGGSVRCSCRVLRGTRVLAAATGPEDPPPQPPVSSQRPLNPTQEIAGQEAEGKALDVGPAKLRIGGYAGLTGIYRSTNSGGGLATKFATIPMTTSCRATSRKPV